LTRPSLVSFISQPGELQHFLYPGFDQIARAAVKEARCVAQSLTGSHVFVKTRVLSQVTDPPAHCQAITGDVLAEHQGFPAEGRVNPNIILMVVLLPAP
jgi:hypothetical protein